MLVKYGTMLDLNVAAHQARPIKRPITVTSQTIIIIIFFSEETRS